jgi:hypothetical protein
MKQHWILGVSILAFIWRVQEVATVDQQGMYKFVICSDFYGFLPTHKCFHAFNIVWYQQDLLQFKIECMHVACIGAHWASINEFNLDSTKLTLLIRIALSICL